VISFPSARRRGWRPKNISVKRSDPIALDQLAEHAKDEGQGKYRRHDRPEARLLHLKEDFVVCLDEADVLPADEGDYLFYLMESQRGHEVQAGIPEGAIDQRPGLPPFSFKEGVNKQDDFGHDERTYKELGRLCRFDVILTEDRNSVDRYQPE
jgi:hypothetical protein